MSTDYGEAAETLRAERRAAVWRLRREGLPLRTIGRRLGISHAVVLDDLKRAREERSRHAGSNGA